MGFPPGKKAAPFGKADGGAGAGAAPLAEEMSESESESASEDEEMSDDASVPPPKKKGDAPNPLMTWAASYKK